MSKLIIYLHPSDNSEYFFVELNQDAKIIDLKYEISLKKDILPHDQLLFYQDVLLQDPHSCLSLNNQEIIFKQYESNQNQTDQMAISLVAICRNGNLEMLHKYIT